MSIEFLLIVLFIIFYSLFLLAAFVFFFKREKKESEKRLKEVEEQSKVLSALWDIEQIIVNSLEFATVGQKIVSAALVELEQYGYLFVSLFTFEKERGSFKKFSAAHAKSIKSQKTVESFFSKEIVVLDTQENLITKALHENHMMIGDNLFDVFGQSVDKLLLENTQKELGVYASIIFPLKAQKKSMGVLVFAVSKRAQDVSAYEIKMMQGFANAVSIALGNSSLYAAVKKTTDELQKANEQLKELDKLKDEFVSLASHELRTPMTAIRGSLSTIIDGYAGQINPQAREFLTAAYNENDRLIRLVNNLLNISRIEAGRLVFEIKTVNLDTIIAEVVKNLQMAAAEKQLSFSYQKNTTLPTVACDADKVREVLINLIGNALKFTHKGGVVVATHVDDSVVTVSVTDTGSGISKEDQGLLFKKFSQIKTYNKQTGGTGLGLYISKKIIEGLGGKIWLESEIGKGSTFFFTLPVASSGQ